MLHTAFEPYQEFLVEYIRQPEKSDMKVQHYHDTYEIYLQLSGDRTLILNDVRYTLKPGDLYILKPFEIHYTESRESDSYERYVINLPVSVLHSLLSEGEIRLLLHKLDSCVLHLSDGQAAQVLEYFRKADAFRRRHGFLADKLLCSVILQLLVLLGDMLEAAGAQDTLEGKSIQPEIVSVIHYINTHYQENITLDTAAALVHMSRYHFCRLFSAATGATFLEYLYNVRLSKVHQMLLDTQLSLSQIAAKCGFASTAHLSRVFRNAYGVSPREFRKAAMEKEAPREATGSCRNA